MNLQSKLIVSVILLSLIIWLMKSFSQKKLTTGQTTFWLMLLVGAEVLTLFPALVHWLSLIWGDLIPVSWISFGGISILIMYLFYQTSKLNVLQSQNTDLARNLAFLEERLRQVEEQSGGNVSSTEK